MFALQTGALTSRAAAFPQNPTGSTLYPDEVTAATEASGAVVRTGEVQRNFNAGTYTHYAATRTYVSADGQTKAVQRYLVRNQTQLDGTYEEYRYDALGRRVLLRTRKPNTPPAAGGTGLCNTTCTGAISRWVWDGAQMLGETRAPGQDGLNSGQLDQLFGSPPNYGTVGYVHHHSGGWDEPLALMDGRIFNRNWRGLPESSQMFDGTAPDCSMGLNPGTCMTVAWPTDVGPYFRRPIPGTQGSIVPTWLGSLAANGATGSGRLHRRFREYDPATGQFTQEDPIGLAGGANLYGFADGDPVNFADPFGLQACPPNSYETPGACLSATGALGALIGSTIAPVVKSIAAMFAGARSARTATLASEAQQIHSALDPIARSRRTTAVLEASGKRIAAGGGRDLTPAQREVARQLGAVPAALPGAHAEITALNQAIQAGLRPDALAIYGPKPICPACAAAIRASGGKMTTPTTAVWP